MLLRICKDATKVLRPFPQDTIELFIKQSGSYIGRQTIKPVKGEQYAYSMGQRIGLSYFDAKAINHEYCSSEYSFNVLTLKHLNFTITLTL